MIKSIKLAGKYLDQPLLVSKFKRAVPKVFTGGAFLYGAGEIKQASEENKITTAVNTASVLTATVVSALYAPKLAFKFVGKSYDKFVKKDIVKRNTVLVDEFIKKEKVSEKVTNILEKAKDKILSFKELKVLDKEVSKTEEGKKFINNLIPEPENVTSKDIKKEIGRLSILGFIPVAGGVTGGLAGEKISTGRLDKTNTANRIKEGAYQYLANIFLCNVGAGMALGALETMNVKSKSARAVGMLAGIVATGVVGGSMIANFIGDRVINPIFDKDKKAKKGLKNINSERKPEIIDICLHTDDIATIAVMSGLKWIEPALPILYGISGYRAGIGYRNGGGK
jgi:hypothetical protein